MYAYAMCICILECACACACEVTHEHVHVHVHVHVRCAENGRRRLPYRVGSSCNVELSPTFGYCIWKFFGAVCKRGAKDRTA